MIPGLGGGGLSNQSSSNARADTSAAATQNNYGWTVATSGSKASTPADSMLLLGLVGAAALIVFALARRS